MKKTYKEKYYELKKENYYLHLIYDNKCIDFNNLKIVFTDFKNDLKEKQDKDNKYFLISFLAGMFIAGIVATIYLFLG